MSRAQLALRVSDLEASITFYSKLFGTEPAKRREGYANFAIAEPPLKLVLIEGEPGEETQLDHLGVEVESTDQVNAATTRLKDAGLATFEDLETGERMPLNSDQVSAVYMERLENWLAAVRMQLLDKQIAYQMIRMDQPPGDALRDFLKQRQKVTG